MIQRSYPIRRAGPVVIAGLFLGTLLSAGLVLAAPLRVGVPSPSVSYLPLIVAWKMDFFAQEGVQTEFIVMKPSIIPPAMVNGEIHLTTATGTAIGATLRGFPVQDCDFLFQQTHGLIDHQSRDPHLRRSARQDHRRRHPGSHD